MVDMTDDSEGFGGGLFGNDDTEVDPYDAIGDFEPDVMASDNSNTAGGILAAPHMMRDCLGHQDVESELLALINKGELPHALIFSGPKGIGKATMAFRLSRYLLKHGVKDSEDDGGGLFGDALPPLPDATTLDIPFDDPVFMQIAASANPNTLYLERAYDERKGQHKKGIDVETARQVVPFMRMTAHDGGWRCVIIDDADLMYNNSQNAILKILEEPPEKTLLVLVTHRLGALIPTIKSRCRTVRFDTLEYDDFNNLLQRVEDVPAKDVKVLFDLSRGCAGRAINMLEEGGLEVIHTVFDLLRNFPRWDWKKIHQIALSMSRKGQENSLRAFEEVMIWFLDSMLRAKASGRELPEIFGAQSFNILLSHYSLMEWIEISTNIKELFIDIERSNLDKRQTVFGVFTLLDEKMAA